MNLLNIKNISYNDWFEKYPHVPTTCELCDCYELMKHLTSSGGKASTTIKKVSNGSQIIKPRRRLETISPPIIIKKPPQWTLLSSASENIAFGKTSRLQATVRRETAEADGPETIFHEIYVIGKRIFSCKSNGAWGLRADTVAVTWRKG